MKLLADDTLLNDVDLDEWIDYLRKLNLNEGDSLETIWTKCHKLLEETEADTEEEDIDRLAEWIAQHLELIVDGDNQDIEELLAEDSADLLRQLKLESSRTFAENQKLQRRSEDLKIAQLFG
jgi:peptide subunit release factor 1 (eRF1)